ncbi:MAG: efflux RND transporter periplasmic adaptor subunit [Acidobacteriota bacterium]|nr:efflux RND transporter periplasmic adaptor subunit [Acidobacteriota bacterium]
MRRWWIRLAILAVIVIAVWVLKVTVFAPDPIPVRVQPVATGLVEATVTNSRAGTVKARRRAKLSPELGGQVVEIPFREGDWVKAGDIVLRLEDSAQRAQLLLTEKELEAAQAERERACLGADRAQREYDRVKKLADQDIISVDLLDQAESAHATAEATCRSAGAQAARAAAAVNLATVQLGKTVLRAPFDGIVAERSAEVGEWTTPSPPALPVPAVLDILDPSSIFISAPMDEVDSALIKTGLSVRVTVDSHRGKDFAGVVTRVAPYVLDFQEQNRTVEVEVELADATFAATLLPGTSADIEVILDARDDVLRVPTGALMEGNKVLVLDAGLLRERDVEVGIRNWNFTEVVSGLSKDDKVVTSLDSPKIVDGAEAVESDEES